MIDLSRSPEAASAAARRVLREDRIHGKPWKRILTAEQEVGLAVLMRESGHPLSRELPEGYRAALEATDERGQAFDALMLHNIRLVWSIARTYTTEGMEPEDIANHGMIGLYRAVEKFDASRGIKFSTYATHWIRQAVTRGIGNESRLIRLPVHVLEEMSKVLRVREHLAMQNRPFTATAIAEEIGLPTRKVVEFLRLEVGVVSLDKPVGEDAGDTLGDFILQQPDNNADPAQVIDRMVLRHLIADALRELPAREALIIRMRVGLDDDVESTLDEIGKKLGVTRERVRQLEVKARTKLLAALSTRGLAPMRPVSQASDGNGTEEPTAEP